MLIKKIVFTFLLIFALSFSVYSADEPSLSARSAVLLNADTLEVLYEKDAYTQRSMASTTKIMTAILAAESGRLFQTVTAKNVASEGTSIGLKDGYKMSLETLVWGMLLESGNDAAKLTANFIAGSEKNFSVLMNKKANEIGMQSTNFVTASGLDDELHYTTAYDMALLGAYAIKNPVFREICSSKTRTVHFIEPEITMTFSNHNRLLSSCEGVFGIKTGFTKKSGRCLVSACERGGITLIAVTLNAGDDWNDHKKLYEYGYGAISCEEVYIRLPGSLKVYGGVCGSVSVKAEDENFIYSFSGDKCEIKQKIYLPTFIYAPVSSGDVVGRAVLLKDSAVIAQTNLIVTESVKATEPTVPLTLSERIIQKIKDIFS